jgi:hypothetical protein
MNNPLPGFDTLLLLGIFIILLLAAITDDISL